MFEEGGGSASGVGRDARVMALMGVAHFTSHFFQLTLPPLFPILKDEFDVPYLALGLIMTVFYAASGLGQAASGFLVDRWGAPRMLVTGMGALALAMGLAGLAGSYWALIPIAALGGLGNAVFHPADFAILNASVHPRRIGRAFSVHGICGTLGFAAAPATMAGLGAIFGWRVALMIVSVLGLGVALFLAVRGGDVRDHRALASARASGAGLVGDLRLLVTPAIVAAFAYFAILAMAQIGIQTFSVAAITTLYDAPLALAGGVLTGFLLGTVAGTLAGGVLADRTRRHDVVAGGGLALSAAFVALAGSATLAFGLLPLVMAGAGFAMGATSPSRDMLVRAATPVGASGKVYGFVYSGLDLGSLLTPVLFGWMLDHGQPRAVFFVSAALLVVTIVTVVQVRRGTVPAPARA